MPALPALIPNGTGTHGGSPYNAAWSQFGCADFFSCIDEDPAAFDIFNISTSDPLARIFLTLTDTPIDFGEMTALSVDLVADSDLGAGPDLSIEVRRSDEIIPLTSKIDFQVSTAPTRHTISFGWVDAANKTIWDNARLMVHGHGCPAGRIRLFAIRLINGTYEVATSSAKHLSLIGVG